MAPTRDRNAEMIDFDCFSSLGAKGAKVRGIARDCGEVEEYLLEAGTGERLDCFFIRWHQSSVRGLRSERTPFGRDSRVVEKGETGLRKRGWVETSGSGGEVAKEAKEKWDRTSGWVDPFCALPARGDTARGRG